MHAGTGATGLLPRLVDDAPPADEASMEASNTSSWLKPYRSPLVQLLVRSSLQSVLLSGLPLGVAADSELELPDMLLSVPASDDGGCPDFADAGGVS